MKSELQAQLFVYPSCSTCRKAIAWLKARKISFEIKNIVDHPPSRTILQEAMNQLEKRKSLFNTNGKSYREIGAKKIESMNNEEALSELLHDGKLIRRPLAILENGRILVGFNSEEWSSNFGN